MALGLYIVKSNLKYVNHMKLTIFSVQMSKSASEFSHKVHDREDAISIMSQSLHSLVALLTPFSSPRKYRNVFFSLLSQMCASQTSPTWVLFCKHVYSFTSAS